MSTSRLVILDRDGVINEDSDDYIKSPDEWVAIPSSLEAISRLNKAGIRVAVATNQSGISRGYYDVETLERIHDKMADSLKAYGGWIDALEFCPDHPDAAGPFRKPAPGMLNKLLDEFSADPTKTWFVGDTKSDIQCARNAGCLPALVKTGKGLRTLESLSPVDFPVYDNLESFVDELLSYS